MNAHSDTACEKQCHGTAGGHGINECGKQLLACLDSVCYVPSHSSRPWARERGPVRELKGQSFGKSAPVVQLLIRVQLFATPWTVACQASLSFAVSWSLTQWTMPSNHLILCHPLLLLPSIFPSIRVFSDESALRITWPKYLNFSISHSNEYSGLISFRIDWFDLLAVQGTLKSLFQHHSSKASILWLSAFFMIQLSHSFMSTGKTIALTVWTFVGKVMSLHFNTLSRFIIAYLPSSRCLLISWLQSPDHPQ